MDSTLHTVHSAWKALTEEIQPLGSDSVPVGEAAGRRLAEPIRADRDNPPAPRSTMDGFALRAADLADPPTRLRVAGEIPAGADHDPRIEPGTCVRIFTGANVPPGADLVVPVEMTSSGSFATNPDDEAIEIAVSLAAGANVIERGHIVGAGDEVLPVGARLDSRQLAVLAAVGRGDVRVFRRPRVRVLNTGRELRTAGQDAGRHQTRDSNGPLVEAALREAGLVDVRRSIVNDDPDELLEALRAAGREADAVLLTGGVSAGRYDFVPDAVQELGGRVVFRGVRVKPGKPQLFARLPGGVLVFGLPGNPLSVVTGLYEFALPALRVLGGCPWTECRPGLELPLGESVRPHHERVLVVPATLASSSRGTVVMPRPASGSGDVIRGGQVQGGFALEPGEDPIPAGAVVCFRPWGEWPS